ncbi:MAG: GNAT family N-acetyltransferase [Phycisphaerae bacterium]|nr:GNAT family N-acetyltransferase [Phycisphaerae bacterium]
MTQGDEITIRTARPEDAERLADIAEQAWQPVWRESRRQLGDELFEQLHPDAVERKRRAVAEHVTDYPAWCFVAEGGGRVVGFLCARLNAGRDGIVAEIGNNAVDPALRGQGIAPKLYEHAMALFRERGQRYVVLTTGLDDAHAPARRAYEKVGMTPVCPTVQYVRAL